MSTIGGTNYNVGYSCSGSAGFFLFSPLALLKILNIYSVVTLLGTHRTRLDLLF